MAAKWINSLDTNSTFRAKTIKQEGFKGNFKIQGQCYHQMGPLMNRRDEESKFIQMYFINNMADQADRRCTVIPNLDKEIVVGLQAMLHEHNQLINSFKTALEDENFDDEVHIVLRSERVPGQHKGTVNAPKTNEVAVLLANQKAGKRDIVLKVRSNDMANDLKIIDAGHVKYDSLQYPLILCYGQDGFDLEKKIKKIEKSDTTLQFYKFHLMVRENSFNHLHRCRELFQQFITDQFAKIDTERLGFIKNHQEKLRIDTYTRAIHATDGDLNNIGKKVVLPSSYTGGPRYMWKKTQDAMTYVRNYGPPDLFITFTTNPKWDEIKKELLPGQQPTDRPDIVSRVFKLKVKNLQEMVTKGQFFGPHTAFMYTIEWQKRGLPHVHMLLWLKEPIPPNRIDSVIRAEIPDRNEDRDLYDIVTTNMVHGPCGKHFNKNSPCMKDGKCTKKFPKEYIKETRSDLEGYPLYRRRRLEDGGHETTVVRGGKEWPIDNRWVVPYNPLLSKAFKAHLNVELCTSIKAIKYVCKYICKGTDMACFGLEDGKKPKNKNDEVELYILARYISSTEAAWRILTFDIHEHYPPVETLAVHLPKQEMVTFNPENETAETIENREGKDSTLTGLFTLCQQDDDAKTLRYVDVPQHYRWFQNKWVKRANNQFKLGRVYSVHPNQIEAFCLRLLLFKVPGPTSFEYLRTVDGETYESFQEACRHHGLLEDDQQYNDALITASLEDAPKKMRDLFCCIVTACPDVTDRLRLWNNHRHSMSEDIIFKEQQKTPNVNVEENDQRMERIFNKCLILLEDKILTMSSKDMSAFQLPIPNRAMDRISTEEKRETYNIEELDQYVIENMEKLTPEQNIVVDTIAENLDQGGVYFVDAPGGTGKTFTSKIALANTRRQGITALAVASSGIAATLLPGGRTAHSTFKLPLDLAKEDKPICNVTRNTDVANIMKEVKLIVWDEATMSHKKAFEAVNRMLQDIRDSKDVLWKIEDYSLKNRADIWRSNDDWTFVEKDSLMIIKNISNNKVLGSTADGKVILEEFNEVNVGQLWIQSKANNEEYFTFKNNVSMKFLTAVSNDTLEVKDQKNEELFGGVLVVLTGDFRQILPVVPGGTKADELDASIKSSFLWEHVKTLKLTKNMRVHLTGDPEAAEFAEILEDIGNGDLGRDTQGIVGFPPDVCVKDKKELIEATYPNLSEHYMNHNYLQERAILAPTNDDVENISKIILEDMPGEGKVFRSFNKVIIQADATKVND